MSVRDTLLRKARAIREDVAYDTKWGTNFPEVYNARLRQASEYERAAAALASPAEPEKSS